jgi:hypothetical protein
MTQNLLNLSSIANILPYYGLYSKNRSLLQELNPSLLQNFSRALNGIFSDPEVDQKIYTSDPHLYKILEQENKYVKIDIGENNLPFENNKVY